MLHRCSRRSGICGVLLLRVAWIHCCHHVEVRTDCCLREAYCEGGRLLLGQNVFRAA